MTGLAISDVGADGSKVLYVGCYAQSPDTGGLGLLKVKADWSVEDFVAVNEGGSSLMGGVLVHMEALPPTCPATNPQPAFCIPPDWPTTVAPSTTPVHSTPKQELFTTKPPGKPGQEKPDQTSGGDKDTISEQVSPSTGAITLTLISLFLL